MPAGVIHVAVLFEYPTLNGGERSMLSVIRCLQSQGKFRFTCIGPDSGPLTERMAQLGIPVCQFSTFDASGNRLSRSSLADRLSETLGDIAPDILHANSLAMSRLAGHSIRTGQPPIRTATGHLRDIIRLSRSAINDLNALQGLIAVSEATRTFHIQQGLQPESCVTIHNGIDPVDLSEPPNLANRQQWFPAISETATVILNVGQICLRKAQRDLAESVVRLIGRGCDLYLLLVGTRLSVKRESVEHEQAIVDIFRDAGVPQRLCLAGQRDDVPELMQLADMMVHVARQEPFGRVLLEAAACELPIICTDVGGTVEMLRPDIDALVCPVSESEALDQAIIRTIRDPRAANARSQEAQQRILTRFSAGQTAGMHERFWRRHVGRTDGIVIER